MHPRQVIAATRFGFGPRPDQPPAADPLAELAAQLRAPAAPASIPAGWEQPPTVAQALAEWRADRDQPLPPGQATRQAKLFEAEGAAWLARCIETAQPFRERLVLFWANHLTVSRRGGFVSVLGGDYLRNAIAPHVTGNFADMLVAATTHPAMLSYLDNNASTGPNSPLGQRNRRGLNENLAREILELHTLSPEGGYTQGEVTELAKILTGWHVENTREPLGTVFRPGAHEPGEKELLGMRFAEGRVALEQVLRHVAALPATQRFLASKLVRHFVADTPPPDAVARIAAVLRDSGGDLLAASLALLDLPGAWRPAQKLRAPIDWVIAAHRAVGAPAADGIQAWRACNGLAQPLWSAPAPNGWADSASAWASPEAVMQRLDWGYAIAGRYARAEPAAVLQTALGPLAGDTLKTAVGRAGAQRDALTMIFASAEFQRR